MNLNEIVTTLRKGFDEGLLSEISRRKDILRLFLKLLEENEDKIVEACAKDLGRHEHETIGFDVLSTKYEINSLLKEMGDFLKDETVSRSFLAILDTLYIQRQPYGLVLVISPWNFPFYLTISPAIGAIAAGNCVLIKPSEYAPNCSSLILELIGKYIDKRICQVVNGDAEFTKNMLASEKFDYIFFTGGTAVGREVYKAAAQHLTPVALELGGMCPSYVHPDANLAMAANRIMWSKLANAGQICITTNHVVCHKDIVEDFTKVLVETLHKYLGDNPRQNSDFGRIINDTHVKRLKGLLDRTKGTIICGGDLDESDRYVAPTIVTNVSWEDSLMSELFGLILPIVTVDSVGELIGKLRSSPKPLATYVFTNDSKVFDQFKHRTSSGALIQNACIIQTLFSELPFGGVGDSGIGQYHGRFSIDTFSHKRAIVHKSTSDMIFNNTIYPPYTESKTSWLRWLMSKSERSKCCIM